jgi:phenylpyruvate tautomerase PptA (4-oxalocrotonate tautomerase family)
MIDISVQQGALPKAKLANLPAQVAQIALKYEGLQGSKIAERFTWILTHEMPAGTLVQADGPPPKPLYRIIITTICGLLSKEKKRLLATEVSKLIYDLEGAQWDPEEAAFRVWILFKDMEDGDWIDGDTVVTLDYVKAVGKDIVVA